MKINSCEQYSDAWWSARLAKPSGSNAKKLVTSTGAPSKTMTEYAIELANDAYAGKSLDTFEGNKWTDRGTELEGEARDFYEFNRDETVIEVGMVTNDDETYLASPDGLVGDNGLLEIKCLSPKVHTKCLMYYAKNKKPPTDYVSQVQMQMFVAEREWCDLLLYSPELPSLIIRTQPDEKIVKTLIGQLQAVIEERDRVVEVLNQF